MRGLRKTAAGVAAVALAAGVIAGCGSSSDTASTAAAESAATSTTAELTQAEYVAKANAICRKIDDVTSTLGDNVDTETLEVRAVTHRFTRLGSHRWRIETEESTDTVEVDVDEHGLPLDYPAGFRRES